MKQITPRQTLTMYWQHSRKYPKPLAVILLGMPMLQFVEDFFVPFLISGILTKLTHLQSGVDLHDFLKPLAVIFVLELGLNFIWRPYIKVVWRFEETVMRDLFRTSFNHLLTMSNQFFTDRFAGSLVSQVNKFANAFERFADAMIWNVYKLVIAYVLTAIILIRPAPLYVGVLTLLTGLYVVVLLKVKKTERPYTKRWASAESQRTGQLADSIGNMLTVKAFAHEKLETKLFNAQTENVYDHSMTTMHKVMRNEGFTSTSQRAINVGAVFTSLLLASQSKIAIGTIYLVLVYTLAIMRRLWDLNNVLRNLNRVFGDAHDMTAILLMPPQILDSSSKKLKAVRGDIVFDDVRFSYPESPDDALFDHFSLHIKPGEKVGLVGRSGSGKTTLTKLLLRFMDISSGAIRIDNTNISQVSQTSLRDHIAYVPQEPQMFHRSLTDNIRYGQLNATDKEVRAAARFAHADEFISQLPHGYETLVGERGTKLSGGQRQRVAIARAMLKNAPILLLDEATSALDSESEALIQDALWKLMEGRTAIVIAHRLSTIQRMDRIIVMDKGQIVEEGSHKELLARNGTYAKLWNHQSGGFIEQ